MNVRMIALAALVSGFAGSLTGCGQVAPSLGVPVPAQAPDVAAEVVSTEMAGPVTSSHEGYSTQCLAPGILFLDNFEGATQESLDKVWQSSSDFRGAIPAIYPAPTSYRPIRPGLAGSQQAVASGGGKAFATHRSFLQLRQALTESRGYEGATRTLTFRYSPHVNIGLLAPGKVEQKVAAQLLVEVSQDGKTWKQLWDSKAFVFMQVSPYPTDVDAKVALPAGKLNLRFVTVAKAGEYTPGIDDVRVMLPMPSVR
jgi:hypothetical protein